MNDIKKEQTCQYGPYIFIIILLIIISILSFFLGKGSFDFSSLNNSSKITKETTKEKEKSSENIIVKVIDDKKCNDCYTNEIIGRLKTIPDFTNAKFEILDFSDEKAKELMTLNSITRLPAILINTNKLSDAQFVSFLTQTESGMYSLNIGAKHDPYAEICDNKIDDNENSKIDCDDKTCSNNFACAPKVDRPVADLYIMSYCPYGLQAQKRYLEVMSKLSNVADINIKWVHYTMHGQKEADENVVQYCIQKEEGKEKYIKYLNCFLKEEGKGIECIKEANINNSKLNTCIEKTKKEFNIDEKITDKTNQYPEFDIDKDSAIKAGVQGSPTFVVNGIKIEKDLRNAKFYAEKICSTFKKIPEECKQDFQDVVFDPMFGFTSNGSNADSSCGL